MKKRRNRGFTLAELLAVVAILIILFAVIAVNVAARQRSMTRLEFDAIAKEIYVAAQNHLTVAESQDYLGLDINQAADFGTKVVDATDPNIISYHYDSTQNRNIQAQMLPPYAVDYGGTFVISYQAHPARVLDVYYSLPGKSSLLTVAGTTIVDDDFSALEAQCKGDANTKNRERFTSSAGTGVVGWYGGGDDVRQGEHLLAPTIEIHNEEQLYVKISDPNAGTGYKLKLVVKGANPAAILTFTLDPSTTDVGINYNTTNNSFSVLLDDITTETKSDGLRFFRDLATSNFWSPGENLTIYAVAYSTTALTNIAKSDEKITNSLFADVTDADGVAKVAYFRHLENLDAAQSSLEPNGGAYSAKQVSDLDWETKWTSWKGDPDGWTNKKIVTLNEENRFLPVNTNYKLTYEGQNHVIKNVKVDYSGSSGLFGSMTVAGSEVNDLELVDFTVTASSGDAGALIGTADGVAVSNVLARNSKEKDSKTAATVTASSGAAGGLIGSMTNGGSVTNSAAALVVSGGTDAGGLIGTSSAAVSNSYAGGHTDYDNHRPTSGYDPNHFNVTSTSGNAGGLIGSMTGGSVSNCYSTCSAEGNTAAGGLIGSASGTCSVNGSYATGLVKSATTANAHALIGTGSASGGTGAGNENYYLWIINQDQDWQKGIVDNSANPAADIPGGITATDADKATTTFVSFFNGSGPAQPYDAKLLASYEGKYPMHRVSTNTTDYVFTHYGDWPMPETLVINN